MDPNEIVNPKKTLRRREEEAGVVAPDLPASGNASQTGFGKKFTAEEKAAHQRKLAEMLRKRP